MIKTIILTGTTSGLGNSLFSILTKEKVHILAIDRRATMIEPTYEIRADIQYLLCDLSSDDLSNFRFLESMFENSSEVIFIMNAATIQPLSLFNLANISDIRKSFNTNFFSYFELLQQLVRITDACGLKLRLVLINTGAINHVIDGWASYSASKSAHLILCRHIASENEHVSLVEFEPGVFESNMQSQIASFSKGNRPTSIRNVLPSPVDISKQIISHLLT